MGCAGLTCGFNERCDAPRRACVSEHCAACESERDCGLGFSCLFDVSGAQRCHMQCERDSECYSNERCATTRISYLGEFELAQKHCVDDVYGCGLNRCGDMSADENSCEPGLICSELNICLECLSDDMCGSETPYCDQGACVECVIDADCAVNEGCQEARCINLPIADRELSAWSNDEPPGCFEFLNINCSPDEECVLRRCTLACNDSLLCPEGSVCCGEICVPESSALNVCD